MAAISLYHISNIAGITCFDPRPAPSSCVDIAEPVVWAIDEAHLHNYLLPRDCPRVTFYPRPDSDPAHVEQRIARFLASWHTLC